MSDDRGERDTGPFGRTYERLQRRRIAIFLVVLAAAVIFAAARTVLNRYRLAGGVTLRQSPSRRAPGRRPS